MEDCEKGGRTLGDLLDELFNVSGDLADFINLREDPGNAGDLQYQLGISGPWTTFTYTPYGSPQAKEWAETVEDTLVSADAGGNQVDEYSAKHYAAKAAASADSFDDHYLGAKAADPTLDNDGDPLQDGATYWNTVIPSLKFYDLGTTTWYTAGTSLPIWADDAGGNLFAGSGAAVVLDTGTNNIILGNSAATWLQHGDRNIVVGYQSMNVGFLAGERNIAIGEYSMRSTSLNTADGNIALGYWGLATLSTGDHNLAIGQQALNTITTQEGNIGIGWWAGKNQTGAYSVSIGYGAGQGGLGQNVSIGYYSGRGFSQGVNNVFIGNEAAGNGSGLGTGDDNVFIGTQVAYAAGITGAARNIGLGATPLAGLTSGDDNIAIGNNAASGMKTGSGVIAIGTGAYENGEQSYTVAIGYQALNSETINGQAMVAIGAFALADSVISAATGRSTAIGFEAGRYLTGVGDYANVLIGHGAGKGLAPAGSGTVGQNIAIGEGAMGGWSFATFRNVAIGDAAGANLGRESATSNNVCVGSETGTNIWSSEYNIMIGFQAGRGGGVGRVGVGKLAQGSTVVRFTLSTHTAQATVVI